MHAFICWFIYCFVYQLFYWHMLLFIPVFIIKKPPSGSFITIYQQFFRKHMWGRFKNLVPLTYLIQACSLWFSHLSSSILPLFYWVCIQQAMHPTSFGHKHARCCHLVHQKLVTQAMQWFQPHRLVSRLGSLSSYGDRLHEWRTEWLLSFAFR